MSRPDDALLASHQLVTVQRHADWLLREAAALGRYPTPIDDLMAAAKLTVVDDEVLDESMLQRFLRRGHAGLATLKSALSKVLGLFEAHDRLVVIDKDIPAPRVPFVKLHEAGHGTLPHQRMAYALMHDCEHTLNPDITDLFEREANVFAAEVLFQGETFAMEAQDKAFGMKTAIALAKQFGASNYATFRRYVTTNPQACCLVVLEPIVRQLEGGFTSEVRRVIASRTFDAIYDGTKLTALVTGTHPLVPVVPIGKRMVFPRGIVLTDRNGERRECLGEAFDTKHQILVLIRDRQALTKTSFIIPTRTIVRAKANKF